MEQLGLAVKLGVAHQQGTKPLATTLFRHDNALDKATGSVARNGTEFDMADYKRVALKQHQTGRQTITG